MPRRRQPLHAPRSPHTAPPRSDLSVLAPLLLTLAASAEVFRVGFFADDFHFLDVARRVPLLQALSGRFGIYPWYRPLSRELYFAIVAHAGPGATIVAHALSVACLAGCALVLRRIARPLLGGTAAAIAPALFVTYAFSRFLTAWASGFQDLLACLLVLLAFDSYLAGRRARAAVWVLAAPFAKETGFVAFPLMLLHAGVCDGERRGRRWMILPASACALALGIHATVRALWHVGGSTVHITYSATALLASLARVLAAFVGGAPAPTALTLLAAAVAGGAAAVMLGSTGSRREQHGQAPHARTFVSLAALAGASLLLGVNLLRFSWPHPYYGFPAAPWLALLAAAWLAKLPGGGLRLVVPALVAWNVLALGYVPPRLDTDAAWEFKQWDWPEAVRLSSVSRRLSAGLRETLRARPESLVVLYDTLPTGTYFQTGDGPATRIALSDPTVRAYFVNDPPSLIPRSKLFILEFDPERHQLRPDARPLAERLNAAATALFTERPAFAYAYASWGDSADYADAGSGYARAVARLLVDGAAGFASELEHTAMADSAGTAPARLAHDSFADQPGLESAYAAVLQRPMTAAVHAALAESLETHGIAVAAGMERRIAVALDPARVADRFELARLLERLRQTPRARRELERIMRDAPGTELERRAREQLARFPE